MSVQNRAGELMENSYTQFGAFVAASIESARVFDEILFSISRRFEVAKSNGTYDIGIDTTTDKPYIVFLPLAFSGIGDGPVNIDVYLGPTYTGGTAISATNRDNESEKSADVVVTMAPTVSDTGTLLPIQFQINSNGTAAVATIGGNVKEDLIFNAKKNTKYLIRLTNTGITDVAKCTVAANWYEVPEGAIKK